MTDFTDEQIRAMAGAQSLLDKLLKNPKTKRETEKAIKTLYPETVTTDDLAAPYVAELSELRKEFKDFIKKQESNEAENTFQEQLTELRGRGFTDDGIEKIKELMVKKSIPDAIVAADHWEKINPPKAQEPSTFQPSSWNFGNQSKDPDLKELFADEDSWADREASRVWAEEVAKKGQIIS